jgi:hypothetical protein
MHSSCKKIQCEWEKILPTLEKMQGISTNAESKEEMNKQKKSGLIGNVISGLASSLKKLPKN